MLFTVYLGSQGLAVSMSEVYMAGLRYFRILANSTCMAPLLHSPYINLIIKGIKRYVIPTLAVCTKNWFSYSEAVHCSQFFNVIRQSHV